MKAIFFSVFTFFFLTGFGQQQTSIQLRHFMQAAPSPANQLPYGANSKAGHYVQAGDAKFITKYMGTENQLLSFTEVFSVPPTRCSSLLTV